MLYELCKRKVISNVLTYLANALQILQILVFCVPFYNLLEKVGKQATHSFKSDTPMMDAM